MMSMDNNKEAFPSQYDEEGISSFDKMEQELRGAQLILKVELTTGQKTELKMFMGHDVALAKGRISQQFGIPYDKIKLFLNDKLMFDPLSFNDFPDIKPEDGPLNVRAVIDDA
eukprot:GEMP01089297.1.p1 GENE.GEMP01089297.1~~GEMP01089297.1.p1  ORF type:complete len:113 (+),score=26.75 GEMP01089297.1:15-353(+)